MDKKKTILIALVVILIVLVIIVMIFANGKDKSNSIDDSNNEVNDVAIENVTNDFYVNTISQDPEEIESLKNTISATGNTDIYQVEEDNNGRRYLQVKQDVQFDVDLAGIIKNAKPEDSEMNELIEKGPTKNGIWISEQSRESFSNLLKDNNINNFNISDDGYLQINNNAGESDIINKLIDMINSDKLYIINTTGLAYQRDYISGEIVEYPFEDMDPYQVIEPFQKDNKIILEVTSNKMGKLSENEILDTITSY